ncbi:unnamed protein product [Lactuca virosa]|uniref:Uncharacterized protein n=1 Tax=Lactuca virosa TaxID=75947 RepID=A0AAU9PKK8_9ASTR|nr:unnamed protein product [Lactuca virosa]
MKASIDLKVHELRTLMSQEVKKIDDNYNLLHMKFDVVTNATTCLIEDITTFNMYYSKDIKVKVEKYDKVLEKIEEFLSEFKETLSKVDL